jgi:hypothetical protein
MGIILEIVSPDNYYTSNQLAFRYTKKILQHFAVNIGGLEGTLEDFAKRVFRTFVEFRVQGWELRIFCLYGGTRTVRLLRSALAAGHPLTWNKLLGSMP